MLSLIDVARAEESRSDGEAEAIAVRTEGFLRDDRRSAQGERRATIKFSLVDPLQQISDDLPRETRIGVGEVLETLPDHRQRLKLLGPRRDVPGTALTAELLHHGSDDFSNQRHAQPCFRARIAEIRCRVRRRGRRATREEGRARASRAMRGGRGRITSELVSVRVGADELIRGTE